MRTPTSLLLLLAAVACGGAEPPAVSVGPVHFTEDQLLGLSPARRASLAHLAALGLAAADSSYGALGAPLVTRWEEDRLLEILAADLTLEKNGVGDDVLEARYLTDPHYELTVRHVLFFSERWRSAAERVAARAKAERALEQIRGGADFAEVAAALSEEPGAEGRQGLLTPGREGAWVDEFWAAASALEVGQVSPVTETQYGFHILRLEGREIVPFAEARTRLAREVADRLEDPAAVLQAWMQESARGISVAPGAVEAEEGADPATVLATWDGGALTLGDWLAWAAAQPASWDGGGRGTDPARFRSSVTELARRRMALAEAGRRGLAVLEEERAQLRRRWEDTTWRWTSSLGFSWGAAPGAVAAAALEALARTGQSASLARQELDEHAPLLRARYPIVVGAPVE